jgi:hypothetical protein
MQTTQRQSPPFGNTFISPYVVNRSFIIIFGSEKPANKQKLKQENRKGRNLDLVNHSLEKPTNEEIPEKKKSVVTYIHSKALSHHILSCHD